MIVETGWSVGAARPFPIAGAVIELAGVGLSGVIHAVVIVPIWSRETVR